MVLDAELNGLRLTDDAEARRGDELDAPVALVRETGDQGVHRGIEAERLHLRRHVVNAAIGEHDGAGNAIRRNVGKRRAQRSEQARAVGLAVGFACFDEAHFEAGDAGKPFLERRARGLGLLRAGAEVLARTLVDDHDEHGGERLTILARERGVGERKHDAGERCNAHRRATAAHEYEKPGDHERDRERDPQYVDRHQRSKCNTETQDRSPIGRAARAAPARGPDRPCNCR